MPIHNSQTTVPPALEDDQEHTASDLVKALGACQSLDSNEAMELIEALKKAVNDDAPGSAGDPNPAVLRELESTFGVDNVWIHRKQKEACDPDDLHIRLASSRTITIPVLVNDERFDCP